LFVNVAFYADAGGVPGAAITDCEFPATTAFTASPTGDLSIEVDCNIPSQFISSTEHYWVSQQVRQNFNSDGQHLWATRNEAVGHPSVWKNPGDGFGSGCTDWQPANATCGQTGQDLLFELGGDRFEIICDGPPVPASGRQGLVLLATLLAGAGSYLLLRRPTAAS